MKKGENKQHEQQVYKQKEKEAEKVVEEEKDKKKPFTLKKNRGDNKLLEQKADNQTPKNEPLKLDMEPQKKP